MSITRQAALEKIRRHPLQATPRLVEQGFVHAGRFEVGAPFHHRDIDFWAAESDRRAVAELFDELGAVRITTSRQRTWLKHDVFLLTCTDGALLVDVKFGDLKVGALTLLSEAELLWSLDEDNRVSGAAQVADQLLQRLAQGKPVDSTRLESSRAIWQGLTGVEKETTTSGYQRRFGNATADAIGELLEGRGSGRGVHFSFRRHMLGAYVSSSGALRTAVAKTVISVVGWGTRRPKPFGQYQVGTITTASGTDANTRSKVLDDVREHIIELGLRCRIFDFGRRSRIARHKAASWVYAVEYLFRTIKPHFYARVLGYSVLCDGYCYDVAMLPGSSTWASRFARWLCPTPDVNVVMYAPPEVTSERETERDFETIERRQAVLADVVESAYARRASLSIDSSKTDSFETRQRIERVILELSHRDWL